MASAPPRLLLALLFGLTTSCSVVVDAAGADELPDASAVSPRRGCTIVSVAPAVALPTQSEDASGAGRRRAILRHDADCLPNNGPGSDWYEPYRITFEQTFTQLPAHPGGTGSWVSDEPQLLDESGQPPRLVDGATEAMGKNCAVLLQKIETETLPCVREKDPATGAQLEEAFERYRSQLKLRQAVTGENSLNALRLARDEDCLVRWHQLQRQMETPLSVCAVK